MSAARRLKRARQKHRAKEFRQSDRGQAYLRAVKAWVRYPDALRDPTRAGHEEVVRLWREYEDLRQRPVPSDDLT